MLELIATIAIAFSLPPNFVIAIALTENPTLNPNAIHHNNDGSIDQGLMQLNDCWFSHEQWNNPVVNITYACMQITYLRARKLNWWQVAIAYNAGIGRLNQPPASSLNYAQRVMELWQERDPRNVMAMGGK
jgi:hypothetical protein